MASSETFLSLAAYSIYLIYEYNSWSLLLGIGEKISDSGCSHTSIELHKFTATDGEERHISLASTCLCHHRLASTWRSSQQSSFWYLSSYLFILCRVFQKIN